jgi:hypothetical protein
MAQFKVTNPNGIDVPAVAEIVAVPAVAEVVGVPAIEAYHANTGDVVELSEAQIEAIEGIEPVAPEVLEA